jgi:hypothetical protein
MSATAVTVSQRPPLWRQLLGFNVLTGIVGAIIGWFIGYWIGGRVHATSIAYYSAESGQNDIQLLWTPPQGNEEVVPAEALRPSVPERQTTTRGQR